MESLMLGFTVLIEIVAIVDAIRSSLSVNKKVLWVILILCVPVLGVILYFLLGRPEQAQAVKG